LISFSNQDKSIEPQIAVLKTAVDNQQATIIYFVLSLVQSIRSIAGFFVKAIAGISTAPLQIYLNDPR